MSTPQRGVATYGVRNVGTVGAENMDTVGETSIDERTFDLLTRQPENLYNL
jgi:hypothetical protein